MNIQRIRSPGDGLIKEWYFREDLKMRETIRIIFYHYLLFVTYLA